MVKLKKYKTKLKVFREDINLFLYKYSDLTLNELKKVNNALKVLEEVSKNVKITLPSY